MRFASFALVVLVLDGQQATAADWYTGASDPPGTDDWIVEVDVSATVTSKNTVFGGAAVTVAAAGTLQAEGLRMRAEGLAGEYTYTRPGLAADAIRSRQESGAALLGYEWKWKDASLAVYGGVNVENTTLSVPDPNNPVVGLGAGAKIVAEFYTEPTPDMMLAGYAAYSTLHSAYYGRVKAGWDIYDRLFLGPEIGVLGNDFFSQYRIGAHLTGFRLGQVQFGLSGGVLHDRVQGAGAYGIVDARAGF